MYWLLLFVGVALAPAAETVAPEEICSQLGFPVLEQRTTLDVRGWPNTTTTLEVSFSDLHGWLKTSFSAGKTLPGGWKVIGVGGSEKTGEISFTLWSPDPNSYVVKATRRAPTQMVLVLRGRAKKRFFPRLAEPAPDHPLPSP